MNEGNAGSTHNPKRVMVVDDSAVMRRLIQAIVEREPAFVVVGTASNGREALDRLAALQPDLITMDVEMPVMDGLTALKKIMSEHSVPVVMLSSYTEEGSTFAFDALALGAADFFHKDMLFNQPPNPLFVDEFLMRCKAALGSQSTRRIKERWDGIDRIMQLFIGFMANCMDEQIKVSDALLNVVNKLKGMIYAFKEEDGRFIYTRYAGGMLERSGMTSSQMIGADLESLFPPEASAFFSTLYRRAWDGEDSVFYEFEWKRSVIQGVFQPIRRNGTVVEVCGLALDLTEQKRLKDQLNTLNMHDPLTGLPHRRYVREAMDGFVSEHSCFSVFYINLDQFKIANDTLGHEVGDKLLQLMARRMKTFARKNTIVFRAGGDEFVVLAAELPREDEQRLSEQMLLALGHPVRIDNHDIQMSASVGVSRFPDDHRDPEHLSRYAHIAMDHAKSLGGNRFQPFEPSFQEKIQLRMTIERHLRKAVEREGFSLHYQPQIDTLEGRIVGFECLIRWNNPELGRVSPATFIPIAEETGLIYGIGEWALREGCRQNKKWQDEDLIRVPVAVNLSPSQFYDQKLKERIESVLAETGLDAQYLVLEITEGMTMHVQGAIAALKDLKALGVSIAIDDFGIGYSALSYLKEFPIDKLKIDQSFVRGMKDHPINASIIHSIQSMASCLGLEVITEGVETEEQVSMLGELGCRMMQGYLFGYPIEAAQVPGLARNYGRT
ncbi:EAL domain-containing protein [Cohnella suwonensis]|uniref:EAL domain-containing protein n=1 Tax=Cohnella suwonensis TaxID=696072 RepID=A0ABW0M2K6_9BACL